MLSRVRMLETLGQREEALMSARAVVISHVTTPSVPTAHPTDAPGPPSRA
jgi:hypothetical protein